jgi:hypothetical protein
MAWMIMDSNGYIFIYINKPINIQGTWIPLDLKFAELKNPSDSVFLIDAYLTPDSPAIQI